MAVSAKSVFTLLRSLPKLAENSISRAGIFDTDEIRRPSFFSVKKELDNFCDDSLARLLGGKVNVDLHSSWSIAFVSYGPLSSSE